VGRLAALGRDLIRFLAQSRSAYAFHFERVSLNFAPEAELSRLQRVERRALLSMKGHFQLDTCSSSTASSSPAWQRRFVVYGHRRDLVRVGIAALAAEAYLPFGGQERS